MENPENENENIPMELSVASVASAAMAVMPEEPAEFGVAAGAAAAAPRKIKPRPKKAAAAAAAAADPNAIARMKKDLEEGRRRLTPEELNNPFSKEFNKLLLKKELLEREMTLHDIGLLPGSDAEDDRDAAAAAAATPGLYPTLNDPNFNTKIALRKEFFDTIVNLDKGKLCNNYFTLWANCLLNDQILF